MKQLLRSTFGTLVVAALLAVTPSMYARGGHGGRHGGHGPGRGGHAAMGHAGFARGGGHAAMRNGGFARGGAVHRGFVNRGGARIGQRGFARQGGVARGSGGVWGHYGDGHSYRDPDSYQWPYYYGFG